MRRIPQLDGLRGIAILMVVIHHYFCMQVTPVPRSLLAYCSHALGLTWSGVDLFFVLSGFLIAGILLDHRGASNYFRVFYARRICRILPLYFLILALFFCCARVVPSSFPAAGWLFGDPFPGWSYATFTQNIFMGRAGDYGPKWLGMTWSLAVEEQFYLFVPMLIRLVPRRALPGVVAAGVLAAPVLRWASPGFHADVNTAWRMDSLLAGAGLAMLVRWEPFVPFILRHRGFLRSVFFLLLVGTGVLTFRPAIFGAFDFFWLAALYATLLLIAFADTEPSLGRVLRFPSLVWVGQVSYGIYLIHQPVSGLLHGWLRHAPPELRAPSDAGVTLLALCLTLLLAALSHRFFEGPILRFGHRFRYVSSRGTDPSEVTATPWQG
jgi:peptidoglycan/LPS O-acetylase OafA/YrhL